MLWWEFMVNVGINQASAVLRADYGVFQRSRHARGRTRARLDPSGRASMLQDVLVGRPTEVDLFAGTKADADHQARGRRRLGVVASDIMAPRFSSSDVEKILSRAVEIEAGRGAGSDERSGGIDRAELVRIATEAGIDARAIERAATEYELVGERTRGSSHSLTQTTVRVVAGSLSVGARERVAREIESAMGASTRAVTSSAGVRLASSNAELHTTGRRTGVDVTEADGSIRLVVRDDLSNLAAGIIGGGVGGFGGGVGIGVGMGVGIGVLGSPLFAIAFPVVCIGASIFGARALVKRLQRDRSAFIEQAADQIAAAIEACATPALFIG